MLVCSSVFGMQLHAQQLFAPTMYHQNILLYNVSMAGAGEQGNVFLSYRSQWKGIPGAPQLAVFTLDAPLAGTKAGLGAMVSDRSAGFLEEFSLKGIYSYHLTIDERSSLHFGLAFGILNTHIDLAQAVVKDADDPFLLSGLQKKMVPDASAGVLYAINKTQIGFSVPQVFGNRIEYAGTDNFMYYRLVRSYVLSARQEMKIDKQKQFSFSPLLLARYTPGAPFQYDVNAVFGYMDRAWLGFYFRSGYALGLNLGLRVHQSIRFGYGWNITTSELKVYTGPAHEFFLAWSFGKKEKNNDAEVQDKYREEIDRLAARVQALSDSLDKQKDARTAAFKKELKDLEEQMAQLKKDTGDSDAALKMQIALLQEKVELLVKLIGN